MPFAIFENKREYRRFERELHNPVKNFDDWISGLEGKIKGVENSVYIISKKDLKKLDKEDIQYKKLNEEEAISCMSNGGKEYFENLKKLHPEFIV